MPLITGTIYLFGQILSFALPVSLLIAFATFFYRQARKFPKNPAPTNSTAAPTNPTATAAATTAPAMITEPPAAPSRPYSDL